MTDIRPRLEAAAADVLVMALTPAQLDAFQHAFDGLIEWNSRINMTAIMDPDGVVIRHFLDSLACLPVLDALTDLSTLIDVGTGAGFPGLPLAIMRPQWSVTLTDSVGKKLRYADQVIADLRLDNLTTLHARAEELGQNPDHRERYDVAAARALAVMPVLCEYLLPLVRPGGWMLAQKGSTAEREIEESTNALTELGGTFTRMESVSLPGVDDLHQIVLIEKTKTTPARYPRRPGTPSRQPL